MHENEGARWGVVIEKDDDGNPRLANLQFVTVSVREADPLSSVQFAGAKK